MERFALNPAPLFVELDRDEEDECVQLDIYRGDVRVDFATVDRNEFYKWPGIFAPSELHQINGILAAEWQQWSMEDQKPAKSVLELFEALKKALEASA